MNRINRTNQILSKTIIVTSILMLIYCLSIGVSCRKDPGSLKSQKQANKSGNTDFCKEGVSTHTSLSKTKGDTSTTRMPSLPGAEDQTKVDTLTLEILERMANSWAVHLNEPNAGQLKDKAAQADKVQTENPNSNKQFSAQGR